MTQPVLKLRLPDLALPPSSSTPLLRRVTIWSLVCLGSIMALGIIATLTVTVTLTVPSTGTLQPAHVVAAHAMESGLIAQVFVGAGDTVEAGAPLAQLDTLAFTAERLQANELEHERRAVMARASAEIPLDAVVREQLVVQAVARGIQASASLRDKLSSFGLNGSPDSIRRLYVLGTHVEIDRAIAELQVAESDLNGANAEQRAHSLAELNLRRHKVALQDAQDRINLLVARRSRLLVRAPVRGVVITPRVEKLAGVVVRQGDVVVELGDTRHWIAVLSATERDIHEVALGDTALLEIAALQRETEHELRGVVAFIAPAPRLLTGPSEQAGAAGYEIHVRLDSASLSRVGTHRLRTGYTVDGRVITRSGRIATLLRAYIVERLRMTS